MICGRIIIGLALIGCLLSVPSKSEPSEESTIDQTSCTSRASEALKHLVIPDEVMELVASIHIDWTPIYYNPVNFFEIIQKLLPINAEYVDSCLKYREDAWPSSKDFKCLEGLDRKLVGDFSRNDKHANQHFKASLLCKLMCQMDTSYTDDSQQVDVSTEERVEKSD